MERRVLSPSAIEIMAKKASADKEIIPLEDYVKRIRSELNKEFGSTVAKTATDILNRQTDIIKWTPSLNLTLSGGVPSGCWVSVAGKPKHGKSSYLLHLAGKAQKLGYTVFYLDVEGRLKGMNLTGTKELDTSEDKFVPIQSTPEKILTTQDYLNSAEKILKTCPKAFLIIDSVSALVDEKELEGGLGTQTRGNNAKVVSQFISIVGQLVSATNSIVAGVVHIIANTSGFGASTAEKCANRWIYQADIQLRIQYIEVWKTGSGASEKVVGQIVHWKCNTSALGQPFGLCDTYLRFGYGPDELYEIIEFGKACGLIEQAGSWSTLTFLENNEELLGKNEEGNVNSTPKFQGVEKVWDYLKANPKVSKFLEEKVLGYSDILVKSGGAD